MQIGGHARWCQCVRRVCAQIIKRIPQLQKLDGAPIEGEERDAANAGAAATIAAA